MTTEVHPRQRYRIDYDDLDVRDLVAQIRESARATSVTRAAFPAAVEERARARVRAAVDLDDRTPYELQRTLHLEGAWNITPEDLVESKGKLSGPVLGAARRLLRPLRKVLANLELPLYKQFKINLGIADALNEMLCRNADLEARLDDVTRRLEALEAGRSNGAND